MKDKTVKIPNITCNHCVMHIKKAAEELKVKADDFDLTTRNVTFWWDEPMTWEKISEKLKEIGYPPQ